MQARWVFFCCSSLALLLSYFSVVNANQQFNTSDTDDAQPTVPPDCTGERTKIVKTAGNILMGDLEIEMISANVLASFDSQTGVNQFFVQGFGLYLFSEPVPESGKIVRIQTFGYLNDDDLSRGFDTIATYIFVVVFRPDVESEAYQLINNPEILAHGFGPGELPEEGEVLDWPVERGDMIGAIIPNCCINMTYELCPAGITLRTAPTDCLSALYYPFNTGTEFDFEGVQTIRQDRFEEVQLSLNMEVKILPNGEESSGSLQIILPAVLVGIVLSALGVVFLLWCILMRRRKQQPKKFLESLRMHSSRREMESNVNGIVATQVADQDRGYVKSVDVTNHTYEQMSPMDVPESPNGYSLVLKEGTEAPTKRDPNSADDGYEGEDGYAWENPYDYDYQEPYFEPANEEEELIAQLNTQLSVTEIPREELELGDVLGSGAFGTVYRGVWSHSETGSDKLVKEEVAVKTIDHQVSQKDKVKFLQEATIMAQFKHSNILRIRGVLTELPMMMLVLDLLEGGDLRQYLLTSVRNRLASLDPLELGSMLLSYTRQIALGMVYLMFKSYVHRDLAARNILVSQDGMICKIADFGLSRDLQKENIYISHGGKVPVKWTAPEALHYRKYSSASDVWSYGCVLYEIWSLGRKPFQEITNPEAMKYISSGHRLAPPTGCPKSIYRIMIECWNPNADERPSFCDITQGLQKPDYYLLKWSAEDVVTYDKETRTIGMPLQLGQGLHEALQNTYVANKS